MNELWKTDVVDFFRNLKLFESRIEQKLHQLKDKQNKDNANN